MEIYLFLLIIGLTNWFLMKATCQPMPVPKCPACQSSDTLGHKRNGFYCTHCGKRIHLADARLYERDVEILLSEPEQYEQYKQCRGSFINMGFGKDKHF